MHAIEFEPSRTNTASAYPTRSLMGYGCACWF